MPIEQSALTRSEDAVAFGTKEIIRHYLGDYGARIAEALIEQGRKLPPVFVEDLAGGSKALTSPPDKQISWGITRQDGKYRVAVILETTNHNSAAAKAAEIIAKSYGGVVVKDISARAHSSDPGRACEPLIKGIHPGASIGHHSGFPGTIGAVIRNTRPDSEWQGLLGAAHVLAHNNVDGGSKSKVLAPSRRDGRGMSDEIAGHLERYKYLNSFDEEIPNTDYLNCVDAAVVKWAPDRGFRHTMPDANYVYLPDLERVGVPGEKMTIRGVLGGENVAERIGTRVCKLGRTSGFTTGQLKYIGIQRQLIRIHGKDHVYTDVLAVSSRKDHPFSEPGDSGALVYTEDGFGVGLIIGGTYGTDHDGPEWMTYISPLDACLRDTETDLLYPEH